LLSTAVLIHCCKLNSQKEDYVWFLGGGSGTPGMIWDWSIQDKKPDLKSIPYGIHNNNASICDKDGNLLFWSNGCAVINRDQEVMPNGDTLNWDIYREVSDWKKCDKGYPGVQNIKIISAPSVYNGYYIFHKARKYNGQFEDYTIELRISYVNMNLDGGKGDLEFFDWTINDTPITDSNLEIISGPYGLDWWIIQPIENDSSFLTYKLSYKGLEKYPDQNSNVLFKRNRSGRGTMRISPDGTKMAYYDYFLNLHVYDFEKQTGQISNHKKVTIFDDAEEKPDNQFRFGSVEWSPNSRFMYVAVRDSLFQVDSWEEDMNDGIRLIDVYDGTLNPVATTFYVASLAPDCKIYICSTNGNRSYHIIHRPDELGTACNFVQNGLQLPASAGSANLPLFPRFRVDEAEKCDSTITSVFGEAVFYRRDLKVYPSPSDGRYTVDIPEEFKDGVLNILTLEGQSIRQFNITSITMKQSIDITSYPKGMYFFELYPTQNQNRVFWGKQVVKH